MEVVEFLTLGGLVDVLLGAEILTAQRCRKSVSASMWTAVMYPAVVDKMSCVAAAPASASGGGCDWWVL